MAHFSSIPCFQRSINIKFKYIKITVLYGASHLYIQGYSKVIVNNLQMISRPTNQNKHKSFINIGTNIYPYWYLNHHVTSTWIVRWKFQL